MLDAYAQNCARRVDAGRVNGQPSDDSPAFMRSVALLGGSRCHSAVMTGRRSFAMTSVAPFMAD
jgi:hypothetical protein